MAKLSSIFLCISNILGLAFTITSLILANKISYETLDDPLEKLDKRLESLFDDDDTDKTENTILEDTTIVSDELSKLSKFCQCGEKIVDNICTEKQIVSGCYDISKNNKSTILRYLEDDCDTISKDIENKGGFSKVFDLNYGTVHKMASGIFIILFVLLSSVIFSIVFCCCPDIGGVFFIIAIVAYILSLTINFIFFIVMIVKYYTGNTGEFLDFYEDCLKGEDKLMDIQNTYKKMNNLNKYMLAFVIINFIHIGLRVVDGIITYRLYKERNEKPI